MPQLLRSAGSHLSSEGAASSQFYYSAPEVPALHAAASFSLPTRHSNPILHSMHSMRMGAAFAAFPNLSSCGSQPNDASNVDWPSSQFQGVATSAAAAAEGMDVQLARQLRARELAQQGCSLLGGMRDG